VLCAVSWFFFVGTERVSLEVGSRKAVLGRYFPLRLQLENRRKERESVGLYSANDDNMTRDTSRDRQIVLNHPQRVFYGGFRGPRSSRGRS
jgi:hypothetical protein